MSTKISGFGKLSAAMRDARGISTKTHFFTREEARIFSKKLIMRRLKAVGYLRFFFVSLANAVKPYINGGQAVRYGKKFSDFQVAINPATASKPICDATISYAYKTRKATTANRASKLLQATLDAAIPATIKDMEQETQRRMDEDARKYSAK
jgi:hypothetical protein